jgi:hypothetical protein
LFGVLRQAARNNMRLNGSIITRRLNRMEVGSLSRFPLVRL